MSLAFFFFFFEICETYLKELDGESCIILFSQNNSFL